MDTKQAAHEGFEQQHAVVIGGSMAGLLAARVLSTHFGQVTVIERDPLPDGAVPCTGVPQGQHVHVLPEGGAMALMDLFPDLFSTMAQEGASGKLGGAITKWLLASGQEVRFLTREQAAYQTLLESGAQGVKGDLKDRPSLDAACQGIDTVITTATPAQRSGAHAGAAERCLLTAHAAELPAAWLPPRYSRGRARRE